MSVSMSYISVITLGVENLKRSVKFYEEGLGLERAEKPIDAVYFNMHGSWLALYPYEKLANYAGVLPPVKSKDFCGVTLSCNVKNQTDVELLMHRAISEGALEVQPAQVMSWGGYSGWISDPDGYLWEIVWNPGWPS